jgi:hypothetical protein
MEYLMLNECEEVGVCLNHFLGCHGSKILMMVCCCEIIKFRHIDG